MTSKTPSVEQIQALREFASANGRSWKNKLLNTWRTGTCSNPDLQRLRNTFGPSWLSKYKLEK